MRGRKINRKREIAKKKEKKFMATEAPIPINNRKLYI
jgi:hypothetical protein